MLVCRSITWSFLVSSPPGCSSSRLRLLYVTVGRRELTSRLACSSGVQQWGTHCGCDAFDALLVAQEYFDSLHILYLQKSNLSPNTEAISNPGLTLQNEEKTKKKHTMFLRPGLLIRRNDLLAKKRTFSSPPRIGLARGCGQSLGLTHIGSHHLKWPNPAIGGAAAVSFQKLLVTSTDWDRVCPPMIAILA